MALVSTRQSDLNLVYEPSALQERISRALSIRCGLESLFRNDHCQYDVRTSSVLVLFGERVFDDSGVPEACIILNKRSMDVKQPGDLCCPGGALERFDPYLARLLLLPGGILPKWPCWRALKHENPANADYLSLLLAAGLRESWEEMGLRPFHLRFLGPIPSQCLVIFPRVIHPLAVWVTRQKSFTLNWEVERVVYIPLRALLNPFNYGRYRLCVPSGMEWRFRGAEVEFPCFMFAHDGRAELLWGATFRIVMQLMEMVFSFIPPQLDKLPLVPARVTRDYVNGKPRAVTSEQ
jgi:8-oxo-dGTP pyrophosphatase MutT (NUDIX family)